MPNIVIKAAAAVVLGMSLAGTTTAGPPASHPSAGHPAMRAGMPNAHMQAVAQAIGLTNAQKAQMQAIMTQGYQQAFALHQNASLTPQAKQAKMMALQQATRKRMMAVLTPAQKQKLAAMNRSKGSGPVAH